MSKKYGYFDDSSREYVITRPDTPLPWLNYLGQDQFFGLCTNTAGGYTFWKDAKLRRLTRYRYNNVPYDLGGRYLYINDNGTVWNPGWKPVKTKLDSYECRHGLGYTSIAGAKDGLTVTATFFVPPGENLEIWDVRVKNTSSGRKQPRLFSFQEFAFFEALNDMTNLQRTYSIGEVEIDGSAIYHKTEYRERRNHYTLFACTRPIDGYDTSRDAFIGIHEGLHDPKVPFAGECTNTRAFGWNPCGAHQVNLDLAPGQEERFAFVLSYVDHDLMGFKGSKFSAPMVVNKEAGKAILAKYQAPGAVDKAFADLKDTWTRLLSTFQGSTPDEHATRMLNTWNQYQCMATFNLSRAASLYETGIGRGMGFRDSNQDLLGFVHMIPSRARGRILDIAATQLSDGTCYHQYQPLTKKGNADIGGDFYDDHLWLILSTTAYIRETGDLTILDEPVGYADRTYQLDPVRKNHDNEPLKVGAETLLHHLETSIAYTLKKRGPHGLPLIGHADWNDCLNLNCFSTEPNESFQTAGDVKDSKAESVMIAGLFLYAARDMKELYEFMGRPDDAARMTTAWLDMNKVLETQAWDGEWYTRAFDAAGNPVGSKVCSEGKIFIESQGWAVLGGAGQDTLIDGSPNPWAGRARQAMASVDKHLYTTNGVVLQQPAYTVYHKELGEVTSYPPGVKENAGIFTHNNTWIHLGWCLLGDGDKALEYYHSVCPSAKQDQIDTYRSEPYVYAQMTAGKDAPCFGEAKNSWLTGTAAWTFVVVSQGILGVQPDFKGLRLDPCIPKSWKEFAIQRTFRGASFDIRVNNPAGVSKGVKSLTVDGKDVPLTGGKAILPLFPEGSRHSVTVTLG